MTTVRIDDRSDPPVYRLISARSETDVASVVAGIIFEAVCAGLGGMACWYIFPLLRPTAPEPPLMEWIAVQMFCVPMVVLGALLALGGVVLACASILAQLVPGRPSFHLDASGLYRMWAGPFGLTRSEFYPFERVLEVRAYRDQILATIWETHGNGTVLTLARDLAAPEVVRVYDRLNADLLRARQQWTEQGLRITRQAAPV